MAYYLIRTSVRITIIVIKWKVGILMDNTQDYVYKISLVKDLISDAYRNSDVAYESLNKFSGDASYLMASNYLIMAHNSYTTFIRFYQENNLQCIELDNWLTAYRHFKFQFDEVISNKDNNTSWLFSAHAQFEASHGEVFRFLTDTIQAHMHLQNK